MAAEGTGGRYVGSGGSRTRATSDASVKVATVENLNQRNILAQKTEYASAMFEGPASCRATVEEFFSLLSPKDGEDGDHYRPLLGAFDRAYESERDFNLAVFRAMAGCVGALSKKENSSFRPELTSAEKTIVLEPKRRASSLVDEEHMEYATGLAREVTLPSDQSCILEPSAIPDHAWVIFRRPVGGGKDPDWKVWIALAVVEFKIGVEVCDGITRTPQGNVDKNLLKPLQASKHGPLAQVIMYTVAHVLWGLAVLGELPSRVPFAAIACKKSTSEEIANGWIHGNLVIPKVCGDRFSFNVDAYGTVHNDTIMNYPSAAAYLHIMTHGLRAAQRWLDLLADANQGASLPAPHWISGEALHFGTDMPLPNVRLAATPVVNYGAHGFRISQGELFEGTVNLRELRSNRTIQDRVYWCQDEFDDKEQSVLIKVSSMACFNLFIPNRDGYLYGLDKAWEQSLVVREALAQSLYGVFVTQDGNGLIQLLPNLAILGYNPLRPQQLLESGGWEGLWCAFTQLVNEVLIPLALSEVVHADIRVGYDESFNILYNPSTASMRLIDLDSLCRFEALKKLPPLNDLRNIRPDELPVKMRTPLGFVLGQVVCVGEVWLQKSGHNSVAANQLIEGAVQRGSDVFDSMAGEASNAAVDDELVRRVLDHYRKQLETKYSSGGPVSTLP
jgi:hypothetical protein